MYRIRITSGEETVFRSPEELALGIRSGVISSDAQIYHKLTECWLPIHLNPDYRAAAHLVPIPTDSPTAALQTLQSPPALPEAEVGDFEGDTKAALEKAQNDVGVQILRMHSQSGRELSQRRKRSLLFWLTAATLFPAAVILAIITMPKTAATPVVASKPVEIVASRPVPPPLTPEAVTDTPSGSAAIPIAIRPATDTIPTPGELAKHRASQGDASRKSFSASLARLGFAGVFSPNRIGSADSVRAGRKAVTNVRALLAQYRGRVIEVERVYQDSADRLIAQLVWPLGGMTMWNGQPKLRESRDDALKTDSLLGTVDQLLELLQEQEGRYATNATSITFGDTAAASVYDRFRTLLDRLSLPDTAAAASPPPPLASLQAAINRPRLPSGIARGPQAPAAINRPHPDSAR